MREDHPRPLCVLLTDFPLGDPYVGVLKGVLLSGLPDLCIVDLAHGLPRGDIRWGALQLTFQPRFFPAGSLFLAVVDPGVGTGRRVLAARSGPWWFVGPDNGLLYPALQAHAGGENPEIVDVDVDAVRTHALGETFHGRDIMAPAAVRLMAGEGLADIGDPITDPVPLTLSAARKEGEIWVGEVLASDGYGNLITSLEAAGLSGAGWRIFLDGRDLGPVRRAYGEVGPGEVLALAGSLGRVEISARGGHARERLAAGPGTAVEARRIA